MSKFTSHVRIAIGFANTLQQVFERSIYMLASHYKRESKLLTTGVHGEGMQLAVNKCNIKNLGFLTSWRFEGLKNKNGSAHTCKNRECLRICRDSKNKTSFYKLGAYTVAACCSNNHFPQTDMLCSILKP